MLEALGVNTSKTLSVIETGEDLMRNDEPSPARSAVMVRLSHSHIRIGTFQRLMALEQTEQLSALVSYCLTQFPGTEPPDDAPGRDEPAVQLMHQVVERMADLAASYMVAGFVHGVLNTDNMNATGESFDYGPWRWLASISYQSAKNPCAKIHKDQTPSSSNIAAHETPKTPPASCVRFSPLTSLRPRITHIGLTRHPKAC
jgi:uncharacterized protein YdiU (UPF0061 family)